MKKTYYIILTLLIGYNTLIAQEKTYLSEAINIAGKQRMLGQRMAKNKVYITASKRTEIAEIELKETILGFKKGLRTLKDFAPNSTIKHKIEIQEYIFNTYKEAILSKNKSSLNEIIKTNTLFLDVCDDVVTELINHSKSISNNNPNSEYLIQHIAEATGASGKLRYLTQRLTLYYAIHKFDINTVTPNEIDLIVKTMEENLNYLTVLEFNTLEIDDALGKVNYYWKQLKDNLYKDGKVDINTKNLSTDSLYDLCNTILKEANTATKMYADLNKS